MVDIRKKGQKRLTTGALAARLKEKEADFMTDAAATVNGTSEPWIAGANETSDNDVFDRGAESCTDVSPGIERVAIITVSQWMRAFKLTVSLLWFLS